MENQTTTTTSSPIKLNETSTIPNPEPQPSPEKAAIKFNKSWQEVQIGSFTEIVPGFTLTTGMRVIKADEITFKEYIFLGKFASKKINKQDAYILWEINELNQVTAVNADYFKYCLFTPFEQVELKNIPILQTEKTIKRKIQELEEEVTEFVKVIAKKQK